MKLIKLPSNKKSIYFKIEAQTGNKIKTKKMLLGNPKKLVKLDNPKTYAEVKLCLFLYTSALKIVCRETQVLNTVASG